MRKRKQVRRTKKLSAPSRREAPSIQRGWTTREYKHAAIGLGLFALVIDGPMAIVILLSQTSDRRSDIPLNVVMFGLSLAAAVTALTAIWLVRRAKDER